MLSYYLPARDGDTIRQICWKKALFLRSCRNALARNSEWRRLGRDGRWEEVRGGSWIRFLPAYLQRKYKEGRQAKGRLAGMRWKLTR